MECPLCNGWKELKEDCPHCGHPLKDEGITANYLGPYSPYQDQDSLIAGFDEWEDPQTCHHLVSCSHCGWEDSLPVEKERIPH